MISENDIHCYWINLDYRRDRKEYMENQFKLQKIPNTRIEAEIPPPKEQYCKALSSHLKSILTAYQDNREIAIIMEDDIDLSAGLYTYINWYKYLPHDWEVFQMHYIEEKLIEELACKVLTPDEWPNVIIKGCMAGLACYMINRKGMEKIINLCGVFEGSVYIPTYTIADNNAKAEDMVYSLTTSYMCLYPLFNTLEKLKSDTNSNIEYMKKFINNMNAIKLLNSKLTVLKPPTNVNSFIEISSMMHFIQDFNTAPDLLNNIFSKHKKIYSYLHSGLGNRLFQYCSAYGVAKDLGVYHDIIAVSNNYQHNSKHNTYIDYFYGFKPHNLKPSYNHIDFEKIEDRNFILTVNNLVPHNIKVLTSKDPYKINYDEDYSENKAYVFNGFYQNELYFIKYRKEILEIFKEPDYVRTALSDVPKLNNIVCIHVRLGDFTNHPHIYINLNKYYKNAMAFIKKQVDNPVFLIVSDEKKLEVIYNTYDSLKNIPILLNNTNDELTELYFMTKTLGVICSNSTFSWWGAWFNTRLDKIITIPSKWLNTTTDILNMSGSHIISI